METTQNSKRFCTTCHCLISITSNEETIHLQWRTEEKRKKIMKLCLTQLFAELIDSSLVWRVCNEPTPPFCSQCLEELEKILKLDENKEAIQRRIDDFVDNFAVKVLRSRKTVGKLVINDLSPYTEGESHSQLESSSNSSTEKSCCTTCHKSYVPKHTNVKLELESAKKILNVCEKHLFKELVSNSSFDWTSMGSNKFFLMCSSCLDSIKHICELNDEMEKADNCTSTAVERFAITILKNRRCAKQMGFKKSLSDSIEKSNKVNESSDPVWDTTTVPMSSTMISEENKVDDTPQDFMEIGMESERPAFMISNPISLFTTGPNDSTLSSISPSTSSIKEVKSPEVEYSKVKSDNVKEEPVNEVHLKETSSVSTPQNPSLQIRIKMGVSHSKDKEGTQQTLSKEVPDKAENRKRVLRKKLKAVLYTYTCPICFKDFAYQGNFIKHATLCSLEPSPVDKQTSHSHTCDVCGRSFTQKHHLASHHRMKKFKCADL